MENLGHDGGSGRTASARLTLFTLDRDGRLERVSGSASPALAQAVGRSVFDACAEAAWFCDLVRAALELWERHRPRIRLLVTAVTLPGALQGLELATRLRTPAPALGVLLTSGYHQELAHPPGLAGPDFVFLAKPWTPEVLVGLVRECLGGGAG